MSKDDRKDKLLLLGLLWDIHAHLLEGKNIHPKSVEVLNPKPDAWTKENAPSITDYIGGVLKEMHAEDLLEKDHQRFLRGEE
jgi:hypothetical protein